jgi:hypothetical protein
MAWRRGVQDQAVFLERAAGIEPARSAWKADRLPLHHARLCPWAPPKASRAMPREMCPKPGISVMSARSPCPYWYIRSKVA